MTLAKAVLSALLMLGVTAAAEQTVPDAKETYDTMGDELTSEDGRNYKLYKYSDVEFKVFKPSDGTMVVEGLGYKGSVFVHNATGEFRGEALGWGSGYDSPEAALDNACRRIIDRAAKPSDKVQREKIDKLYEDLGGDA